MTRFVGIDPASKTGFVVLDQNGKLLEAKEISGDKKGSPALRICTLHDNILSQLQMGDMIGVEWFALAAKDTNKTSSGANWAARMAASRACDNIVSPLPGDVKAWVGVEEWEGEYRRKGVGGRVRKDSGSVKKEIMQAVEAQYGFKPATDNIADAYVIAKITLGVYCHRQGWAITLANPAQHEILTRLAYPEEHKRKMAEAKKSKKTRKKP